MKLDRSFVAAIDTQDENQCVAQAVLRLAEALGLRAIAEGVETPRHEAAVTDLGFRTVQGFHYSRPVPAADVPALVASRRVVANTV